MVPPTPLGWRPANQPTPKAVSGGVVRSGGQASFVGCLLPLPCVLCCVQRGCTGDLSFVGARAHLANLLLFRSPQNTEYMYLTIIAELTFLPSRRYPPRDGAYACCLCSV